VHTLKPTRCSNYCPIFIYYTSYIDELVTVPLLTGEDEKATQFLYANVHYLTTGQ